MVSNDFILGYGAGKAAGGDTPALVWSLQSPVTLPGDGTNVVDTNIHPFRDYDAFSILVEAETSTSQSGSRVIAHCMKEIDPYPGIVFDRGQGGNYRTAFGTQILSTPFSVNKVVRFAFTISKVSGTYYVQRALFKDGDASIQYVSNPSTADVSGITQSVLLGSYQDTNGNRGRYFIGTINNARIYSGELAYSAIIDFMNTGVAFDEAAEINNILLGDVS